MTSMLSFNNVSIYSQGNTEVTTLEITPAFIRTRSEANPFKLNKNNVKKVEWFPTSAGNKLRVRHHNSQVYEFLGLLSSQFEEVKNFFQQHYGLVVEKGSTCTKGYNWGELNIEDSIVSFNSISNEEVFSIGMSEVRNCLAVEKQNELILEMYEDGEEASKFDETLVEIRFALPTEQTDKLKEIHENIMKQAEVISDTGDSIATFSNCPFAAPRGRYSVELFPKFMRVRGKTYDFKILYRSINMMFLLDDPDGRHVFFVIYLATPIRQGSKQHFHLVIHYDKSEVIDAMKPFEINLSQEEIDKKFPKQGIKEKMTGKLFEVAAKVFRALTGKKLIGAGDFTSNDGNKGVKASIKTSEGILFFLQKSLFFLYKPATYIRHDEISQVSFQRAENKAFHGSRFFDLVIHYRNGKNTTFTNIEKKEEDAIMRYFSRKDIRVEGELQRQREKDMMGLEDEESDEDFEVEESDEEADEADEADFEEFVGDDKAPASEEDEEEDAEEDAEDTVNGANGAIDEDRKRKRENGTETKPSKKPKNEE